MEPVTTGDHLRVDETVDDAAGRRPADHRDMRMVPMTRTGVLVPGRPMVIGSVLIRPLVIEGWLADPRIVADRPDLHLDTVEPGTTAILAGAAIGLALVLVVVAVATGRGWRSAWWLWSLSPDISRGGRWRLAKVRMTRRSAATSARWRRASAAPCWRSRSSTTSR